jgi:GAF domain-containing protein
MTLPDTLTRVAELAVRAIPGADGAGLTLIEESRSDTIVATAPFVTQIDDIQYSLGQGPCVRAAAEGTTMVSGSLQFDPRWRDFGREVASLGVHSVVSLPLLTAEGVVGAMNVYASAGNAFDDEAVQLGELFAGPAAIAVQHAQVLAQTRRLATQLQAALRDRSVVEQAVGITMSRSGISADQALSQLRGLSQDAHLKMAAVARTIVDDAVQRAKARPGPSPRPGPGVDSA